MDLHMLSVHKTKQLAELVEYMIEKLLLAFGLLAGSHSPEVFLS